MFGHFFLTISVGTKSLNITRNIIKKTEVLTYKKHGSGDRNHELKKIQPFVQSTKN